MEERPWGNFTVLEENEQFKMKKIVVKPNQRLSYQSHQKRGEIWVVIKGKGVFTLNDETADISVGSVCMIPVESKHRIQNTGEEDLLFFEFQLGEYFGEDDIVRYSDDYGRVEQ